MIMNPVPWPNGARCAAALTFDMDADSILHLEHPDDSISRVSAISMLRYGPEVAVPRIVETYKRFGIKQTFFVPAWCIEQDPNCQQAMVNRLEPIFEAVFDDANFFPPLSRGSCPERVLGAATLVSQNARNCPSPAVFRASNRSIRLRFWCS